MSLHQTNKCTLETHCGEKWNKCNQCDFASSKADDLRRHLKSHSGEKSNKCNQCDYASSQAGGLKIHLKMHCGENETNATNVTLHPQRQTIWGDIWKRTVEKSKKCNQCDHASSQASEKHSAVEKKCNQNCNVTLPLLSSSCELSKVQDTVESWWTHYS